MLGEYEEQLVHMGRRSFCVLAELLRRTNADQYWTVAGRKEERSQDHRKGVVRQCGGDGVRLGFKPYEINPFTGIPAPAILRPQPSDSWSWASWSAMLHYDNA
jgi:hypothetical protein